MTKNKVIINIQYTSNT